MKTFVAAPEDPRGALYRAIASVFVALLGTVPHLVADLARKEK